MPRLLDWRAAPLLALLACSPALDWREVRVDDAGLIAQFPCRPERQTRDLAVAGRRVHMQMVACKAGGSTYAASFFSLEDPGAVKAALEALLSAAATNVGSVPGAVRPFAPAGATPNAAAGRLALEGRGPG